MSLTVAVYGAGERAEPYLKALARRPDVSLSAVCDPDRRSAEAVAAGWGARVVASAESLLSEPLPGALFVCAPAPLHGDLLLRAAALGVPFFVEPPGAVDFATAQKIAAAVTTARLVTAVGFAARFTDVLREGREFLGSNVVPLALGWWLRPNGEGSADAAHVLWSEGCRLVDALRYFCGEVKRVQALRAGTSGGGLVVQMEFAAATVGVLSCTAYPRPDARVEVELLGEGWTLGFGAEGRELTTLRLVERDKTTILRRLNDPAEDHVTAFIEAIATGKLAGLPTGYAEALRTLAVCHAAAESAREGNARELTPA
jgi:UDP-N-acetyl-2-amino-2-deoxyglucuronate dehydrogenase